MLFVLIPVTDEARAHAFFTNVLRFNCDGDGYVVPGGGASARLRLRLITDDIAEKYELPQRRFPLFLYEMPGGFADLMRRLLKEGLNVRSVFEHMGGYFAQISDPFGNCIEIDCGEFDDELTEELKLRLPFKRL